MQRGITFSDQEVEELIKSEAARLTGVQVEKLRLLSTKDLQVYVTHADPDMDLTLQFES